MMRFKLPFITIFAAAFLASCGSHEHSHDGHDHEHEGHSHEHEMEGHNHEHEHEGEEHAPGEIVLDPAMAKRMGVKTQVVAPGDFCATLLVSGRVMPAPQDMAVAVAPTSGTVTFAAGIMPGVTVSTGTSIATVRPEAVSGGNPDEGARRALEAARKELERARPLAAEGIVSEKEFNRIQSEYDAALAAYSPRASSGAVISPIAGVITELLVKQGEFAAAGQPVAQISKNTQLTLRAELPERKASFLPQITGANIRLSGSDQVVSLADLGGKITGGAAQTESRQGYVPVWFTFRNNGSVVPGSWVEVWLKGSKRSDVISVPVEALTEQQGALYVYVQIDEHGYERRLVTTGGSDGARVEIATGLNPGDKVVVAGASAVKLAENSGAIPEGHSHSH